MNKLQKRLAGVAAAGALVLSGAAGAWTMTGIAGAGHHRCDRYDHGRPTRRDLDEGLRDQNQRRQGRRGQGWRGRRASGRRGWQPAGGLQRTGWAPGTTATPG